MSSGDGAGAWPERWATNRFLLAEGPGWTSAVGRGDDSAILLARSDTRQILALGDPAAASELVTAEVGSGRWGEGQGAIAVCTVPRGTVVPAAVHDRARRIYQRLGFRAPITFTSYRPGRLSA